MGVCRALRTNTKLTLFILFILLGIFCYFANIVTSPSDNANTAVVPSGRESYSSRKTHFYSAINRDRVHRVRKYCVNSKQEFFNRYPDLKRLEHALTEYIWLASPQHHLFYCATPNSASTTWKAYLLEDLGVNYTKDVHSAAIDHLALYLHVPPHKQDVLEFLNDYRPANRLTIVRNPWARLISAYQDKIVKFKWPLKKLCLAANEYPVDVQVTFFVFIDCLTRSRRDVVWEAHVSPVSTLCAFCHMDYTMIVKLEELEKAEHFIKESLNFKHDELSYQPVLHDKATDSYTSYYKNLTKEHIQKLRDIYKDDIMLFEYPPSPFGELQ